MLTGSKWQLLEVNITAFSVPDKPDFIFMDLFYYLSDKGSAVAEVLFLVSIVCLKEVNDREVPV